RLSRARDERCRALQPDCWIGTVVRLLCRLDIVQKMAIDDGLARRRNRREQGLRSLGLTGRQNPAPSSIPMLANGRNELARHALEKRRSIEQWMTNSAITPVEQAERRSVSAKVPGVKVPVHERICKTAGAHGAQTRRQVGNEASQRAAF